MTTRESVVTRMPIAIVGIGCRFPGEVVDVEGLWRLLAEGRDVITEIPPDRIDLGRFYDEKPATPGRIMTRFGGYLSRIDEMDAAFFGIAPVEAECMDPHQRLLLETAWEALEDAGTDMASLEGTPGAVFMGQWTSDFENRLFADPDQVTFPMTLGSGRYGAAARLSYALGLRGPSLSIDAACSSGLASVHLGVQSLRTGECEIALVGAANLILQPHIHIAYSQSRMMAPDGRCKFGDESGNGYVRSEGVGVMVLKTLDKALGDGDRIHAVIRGSAVNNDGRSSGSMGRPGRVGQEELLRRAYADAGIGPSAVGYVEAHGTGTRAGDPVELGALAAVLGEGASGGRRAWVGSIKTNIGHTEATAGIAGLIKAALVLSHQAIPPSLHFRNPNPAIPWADLPLAIPTELMAWPRSERARVAGVSAYGIGGTNAHVVLEEAPTAEERGEPMATAMGPYLLLISARSPEALRALAVRYADFLAKPDAPDLRDVCWSAATRRTALSHRAAFIAADASAMVQALRAYPSGEAASAEGVAPESESPRIAFVAPGQGGQWTGMGRELMAREPAFRAALESCDRAARPWIDWSIVEQLSLDPGQHGYLLDRIDVIQPVLVALAIAYAHVLRLRGVEPDALVGHSMGEVAAAHLAGAIDLERAMQIICRRSALMSRAAGRGAMALVELTPDEAAARLAGLGDRVCVAGNNSPRGSVISGEPDAVNQVLAGLEADGIFARLVKVDVASHGPQMEPHAAELRRELAGLMPEATRVAFHSTVLGRPAEGAELGEGYWANNLRQPVLFGAATRSLVDEGTAVFVELGPHPVLVPSIQQTARAASREVTAIACGRREEPEAATLLAAVAGLWTAGCRVDWEKVLGGAGRNVALPHYPWQRERHWAEAASMEGAAGPRRRARVDGEASGWLHRLQWRPLDPVAREALAPVEWLVVSADEGRADELAAGMRRAGLPAEGTRLEGLRAAVESTSVRRGIVALADGSAPAAYLPLDVLNALPGSGFASLRIWFVTRGGQAIDGCAALPVGVDQAALWGAARVVGEEHPELWGGVIDLDPASDASANANLLCAHLRADDGEDQVAFRDGKRHVLRLVPAPFAGDAVARPWAFNATWLVTGGLGGVALHLVRNMAAHGARRFVLLGRTPLPPREQWASTPPESPAGRRIREVLALEADGISVHVAAVDVGDEGRVREFLESYRAQAWPPIRGVVHAAGCLDNRLAATMDRAAFDAVMRPKLEGAKILDRLLPALDAFVLVSSVGSFLPQPGQSNYAAANAGLDALAQDRAARGQPALSIAWGVWKDVGLVSDAAGALNVKEMERQGLRAFEPARAADLFSRLCSRPGSTVAVLPIDVAAFRKARAGRGLALFRDLPAPGASPDASRELATELSLGSLPRRRALLEPIVREALGRVLKIPAARLDPRKALGNMGLNSLMAMELRNRLEIVLGRSLPATLAWNHPTIEALVEHLAGDATQGPPNVRAANVAPQSVDPGAVPPLGTVVADVARKSDEEAILALRNRGTGSR